MPGIASASYALAHISSLLQRGSRIVECRLPSWGKEDPLDVYRHPLLGDVVDASSLVVRMHRQVWKRTVKGVTEYHRQYALELIGASTCTIRFRRMADFAFRPTAPAGQTEHPTMALHQALVRMDVDAIRAYRFPTESETYQVPDVQGTLTSNLAMLPPPFFSRQELPFHYAYRQNPTSSLQTVSLAETSKRARRTARKGSYESQDTPLPPVTTTRYINRARWRNLAPIAIKFGDTGPVPAHAEDSLLQMALSDRQKTLLKTLHKVGPSFTDLVAHGYSSYLVATQLAESIHCGRGQNAHAVCTIVS